MNLIFKPLNIRRLLQYLSGKLSERVTGNSSGTQKKNGSSTTLLMTLLKYMTSLGKTYPRETTPDPVGEMGS
jgi:hypothetical protein